MADDYYEAHKDDPMWRETKRARDNAFYQHRKGKPKMSGTRIPDSLLLEKALKLYDAKCACCGESERLFLTLVRKDGGKFNLKTAIEEVSHAVYEVKCFNCIMGQTRTGSVCPHKLGEVIWEDREAKVVSPVAPNSLDKWCGGP